MKVGKSKCAIALECETYKFHGCDTNKNSYPIVIITLKMAYNQWAYLCAYTRKRLEYIESIRLCKCISNRNTQIYIACISYLNDFFIRFRISIYTFLVVAVFSIVVIVVRWCRVFIENVEKQKKKHTYTRCTHEASLWIF